MGQNARMGGGRLLLLCLTLAGCSSSSTRNDAAGTTDAGTHQTRTIEMRTLDDSISYAIGMNVGNSLRQGAMSDSMPFNEELITAGLRDAIHRHQTALDDATAQKVMMVFQENLMKRQQQHMGEKSIGNAEREKSFLAENARKPGVFTTASGLQYQILTEGSGERPDANDEVSVEYRGWLIDGTEFDRSDEGIPVTFPVNGVISGWTEALQLMTKGSTYRLFIPSALAYGARGAAGGAIGPNETLMFDVTLLDVHKR